MNRSQYLKELRITHRFLSECGLDVPRRLLVELSEMIREEEQQRRTRRLSRATEEELIRLAQKKMFTLSVTMADGRLIRSRTNEQTFRAVLCEIGVERVWNLGLSIGRHPLVMHDPTQKRKRIVGYYFVSPGFFTYRLSVSKEIASLLSVIDSRLQLNMSIHLD